MGATKESSWSFGIFAASAAGALACCETGCDCVDGRVPGSSTIEHSTAVSRLDTVRNFIFHLYASSPITNSSSALFATLAKMTAAAGNREKLRIPDLENQKGIPAPRRTSPTVSIDSLLESLSALIVRTS